MYTINDLSVMTGLTTRTIRNYCKLGVLEGEKVDGVWQFTPEQFCAFLADPNVRPTLQAKNRSIVFDFLAQDWKDTDAVCVVLDRKVDADEADALSRAFCEAVNQRTGVRLSFQFADGHARVILSGPETCLRDILEQCDRV